MKIVRGITILAIAGICSSASACCGPDGQGVKMEQYKVKVPDCNFEKKVYIKTPPPPVITKYICGKCEKEFSYTKETPYCTACVPRIKKVIIDPPEPEPEVVYVRPPPRPAPKPCPTPQYIYMAPRGQIFLEDPRPPVIFFQQPVLRHHYRESFSESHSSSRTWERWWAQ